MDESTRVVASVAFGRGGKVAGVVKTVKVEMVVW